MDNTIKRCAECDHIYIKWNECCCKSPKNVKPVNQLVGCPIGDKNPIYTYCRDLREEENSWCKYELCGPEGNWFEPKKPKKSLYERIKSFIQSL